MLGFGYQRSRKLDSGRAKTIDWMWIQEMEGLLPPCRVKFLGAEKGVCSLQTEAWIGLGVAKIVCVSLSRVEFKGIG